MPAEREVRQAMIEILRDASVPRDELLATLTSDARLGAVDGAARVAERLLQRDMAFAEITGEVCYVPAIAEGTTWTIPVSSDDIERGFIRMHPALSPLGWWLVATGADLVADDGTRLGRITTDGAWIDDDEPDVDVVMGPPGWLDVGSDGWMTLTVTSEQLRVARLDHPPAATPRQIAAIRAGFERCAETNDAVLFDGEHTELTSTAIDLVVLAALAADRDAFVESPVPYVSDLLAAAGLEEHRTTVAEAGFDWDALEQRRRRNRMNAFYGLDERQIDALMLLVGAFEMHVAEHDDALGETEDERDGAAMLMSALFELDGVAEAFMTETASRGAEIGDIEAFVDALSSRAVEVELYAIGWIKAECLVERGDDRASIELIERLAGPECTFRPVLIDAAGIASDRGDARAAVRLLARAGITERDLLDADADDRWVDPDAAFGLLAEVWPYTQRQPKAPVGRNERCPCGSGRKYKACHLGTERHELADRSSWLYDKAARYVRTECAEFVREIAGDLAEGSFRVARELASAPLVVDLVLHEDGVLAAFLETRGWLLPDDEVLLAEQWTLVDRGVFEILEVRGDELRLRDVGRGETITVTNTYPSEATRPGMHLIGRPLPVGDIHRAFSGFMAVPPQLVNPLIDAIAASDVDELITLLASLFRPPTLRNTSGEELVFHTITWAVAEPESIGAALTAAGLDGDDDEWRLTEDTPGMRDAIMTTVRFDASDGVLVAETNSDERAAHITEVIADPLPSARLLHDERRTFDDVRADRLDDEYLDDDDASGGLDPDDPEIRRMLDEFVKAKEIEWVDEQIPALGGRTPREAVADPIGREEVIQLLASLPEPPPGEVGAFSAARLRAHLGLDD